MDSQGAEEGQDGQHAAVLVVGGLGEAELLEVGATEHAVDGVQPGWVQNPKPSPQTVVKVGGKGSRGSGRAGR